MRTSRVAAFVIASLLASAPKAPAQGAAPADRTARQEQRMKPEGGARAGRGRGGMLNGITLNDGERAQLAAIRARYRTEVQALHDRQLTEMRGALGAENQKVFDANRAARATRRAEWVKGGQAGGMEGRRGMRGRHRGHQHPRRAGANG